MDSIVYIHQKLRRLIFNSTKILKLYLITKTLDAFKICTENENLKKIYIYRANLWIYSAGVRVDPSEVKHFLEII